MTVAAPTYTAKIGASALSVAAGRLSLDAGRVPHVEGDIEIAMPSSVTYAALDPRSSPAPRVVVTCSAGIPRTFNLHVRDREINHRDGTVTLRLSSDEGLLTDFAPLDDDLTPLSYQSSIAAMTGYVLGKVIPGAVVAAGPDAAITALAPSSNLIRNPRAAANTTDWRATWTSGGISLNRITSNGPAYAPSYVACMSAAGQFTNNAEIFIDETAVSIAPGKQHVLSVSLSGSTGRQLILDAVCFDVNGNIVGYVPAVTTAMGGGWVRAVTAPFEAYPNTARVRVRVRAVQLGGSEYVNITGWRLSEFTGDITSDGTYFDGATPDTAQYDYEWAQTAHASISTRKVKIDAPTPDALTWRAGVSALDFLHPLLQAKGLRLVCDETRTWTLRDASYVATGTTVVRVGVNLIDGTEKISRDAGVWFDARAVVYTWDDPNGARRRKVDAYALTILYSRLSTLEVNAPYPGPGRAQYAVTRAQGVGREVTVTTVNEWGTRAEQPISLILPDTPALAGTVQSVTFDLSTDEMTVTARTVDVGARSINALTGTINALTGTIKNL